MDAKDLRDRMRDGNAAPFSREGLGQGAESVCHWHKRGLDVERVGVWTLPYAETETSNRNFFVGP